MKEKDGKYTVDGLLRSVLKTVTVTVIVSQKGAGIFDTVHGYYSLSILGLTTTRTTSRDMKPKGVMKIHYWK